MALCIHRLPPVLGTLILSVLLVSLNPSTHDLYLLMPGTRELCPLLPHLHEVDEYQMLADGQARSHKIPFFYFDVVK